MSTDNMIIEKAAVERAWGTYPIVSARWTGEEQTMQWIPLEDNRTEITGW